MVTKLLTAEDSIAGAVGLNWRDGTLMRFNAKVVVVATGGTGHMYKYTDNPVYMTGDGYAMMYQAGPSWSIWNSATFNSVSTIRSKCSAILPTAGYG